VSPAGAEPCVAVDPRFLVEAVCTLHGLPIAAAITGTKTDERQVLLGMSDDTVLAH
jgi:hypothetical protein